MGSVRASLVTLLLGEASFLISSICQLSTLHASAMGAETTLSHSSAQASAGLRPKPESSCGHDVQFYSDDVFLLDSLTPFFRKSLITGNAAVVIATRDHLDNLLRRLESSGVPLAAAVNEGRYIALSAQETLSRFYGGRPARRGTIFQDRRQYSGT